MEGKNSGTQQRAIGPIVSLHVCIIVLNSKFEIAAHASPVALNEGRGTNPGNTAADDARIRELEAAQRRPGHEPRQHSIANISKSWSRTAQRRPGHEPRQHPELIRAGTSDQPALNEGRGTNPGNTASRLATDVPPHPLNEGRGTNPGNTSPETAIMATIFDAQRRPGHEPRQHNCVTDHIPDGLNAQRRPGHEPRQHPSGKLGSHLAMVAQRRPGHEPRQHEVRAAVVADPPAGAQRRPGHEPRQHAEASSRVVMKFRHAQRRPGHEPRQHGHCPWPVLGIEPRSTKAGARTPATRPNFCPGVDSSVRSTKAGARTPATRRRIPRACP